MQRKKIFYALTGSLGVIVATVILVRPASPAPAQQSTLGPAASQSQDATITWSIPQLTTTLFPGTSATPTVSFRSSQALTDIVIEATSSLKGIVSVNPSSLGSIVANQDYQLSVTVTAPQDFEKRSFTGTIHVRGSSQPRNTYATPLPVILQTGFTIFSNSVLGFSVAYPTSLVVSQPDSDTTLLAPSALSQGDEIGAVRIVVTQNPDGKDVLSFYSDLLARSGGVYATGSVDRASYYKFDPYITEAGEAAVIIARDGYFLEIHGPSDPGVMSVLPSLHFQR